MYPDGVGRLGGVVAVTAGPITPNGPGSVVVVVRGVVVVVVDVVVVVVLVVVVVVVSGAPPMSVIPGSRRDVTK